MTTTKNPTEICIFFCRELCIIVYFCSHLRLGKHAVNKSFESINMQNTSFNTNIQRLLPRFIRYCSAML